MNNDLSDLERHREKLIEYLKEKLLVADWHAIRDVCVDIEIIEAKMEFILEEYEEEWISSNEEN